MGPKNLSRMSNANSGIGSEDDMCGLRHQRYLVSKNSVNHTYLVWKGVSRIRGNAGIGG
jgi:hypothetical protein